ncbi:DNA ligase [Bacterioplanoides pacificum]|uniref:DNA ligase n=1 Tax=Bacterioplanoides pacificum TaxID=1171596 RepID=A0ABV7VPP5_9GAMM
MPVYLFIAVFMLVSLWPLASLSAQLIPPPLMLAQHYVDGIDVKKYYVSEKLDGVRAYWNGQSLFSRSGRKIPAPVWFVSALPDKPLDGELWLGRGRFDDISALVRSRKDNDDVWRRVKFMVYDLPDSNAPFHERYWLLKTLVAQYHTPWVKALDQKKVASDQALNDWLQRITSIGGEGLMLRHENARYQAKRSNDLLKLKPQYDAEAVVVDYVPGQGKYQGMVGALLVRGKNGRHFRLGSGLSDQQRRNPPPLGAEVTYSYSGTTRTGLPRFARFVRLREVE